MAVHLPSSAELECDSCGVTIDVDLIPFAGDPESVGFDDSDLPEGWTTPAEDEHLCPSCSGNGEES